MSDKPILIGDEYISQVRSFGALGYTVKRICTLLSLTKEQRIALSMRMSLPGDIYYEAYQNGRAIGEYNIDAELSKKAELGDIDAITLLEERKNERVEIDLRQQLFGV
jgi:hypothetical protein